MSERLFTYRYGFVTEYRIRNYCNIIYCIIIELKHYETSNGCLMDNMAGGNLSSVFFLPPETAMSDHGGDTIGNALSLMW